MTVAMVITVDRRIRHWPGLLKAADMLLTDPVEDCQAADLCDIGECRNGDGDRFRLIIERHQGRVATMMWRFTRDRLQHEELVQEVFVQAWLSLGSYRSRAPFAHWLARIATRTGYRFWRQQSRERERVALPVEELDRVLSDDSRLEPDAAGELLYALLAQLPHRDRLVLTLRYLEGLSIAETSQRTGWSPALVKVQAVRAKVRLEKLLRNAPEVQR